MQQQQYFEESNPHRLLESLVAISTQDYSIRPVIATVPQPLHRRQPPSMLATTIPMALILRANGNLFYLFLF